MNLCIKRPFPVNSVHMSMRNGAHMNACTCGSILYIKIQVIYNRGVLEHKINVMIYVVISVPEYSLSAYAESPASFAFHSSM